MFSLYRRIHALPHNLQLLVFLTLGLTLWVCSGLIFPSRPIPAETAATEATTLIVQVRESKAIPAIRTISLNGITEALQRVSLRAQADGTIVELPLTEGTVVPTGTVIAQLQVTERQAAVRSADALVREREAQLRASQALKRQGYEGKLALARAEAALAEAKSARSQAGEALNYTRVTAPFAGRVDTVSVKLGDYVRKGEQEIAVLLQLDPMTVVVHASDAQQSSIRPESKAGVQFRDGTMREGVVSFVSRSADPVTRTFRVEIVLSNADHRLADGVSTTVLLPVEQVMAHRIPASLVSLNDAGEVGVKTVEKDGRVAFHPITIVNATRDGLDITGLPQQATLITRGQEFVKAGEKVEAVASPL
jgi:multidrug efflux system membrane fusion protein